MSRPATVESPFFEMLAQFATAHAIFAAFEAGLWEPFEKDLQATIDPEQHARARGLDARLNVGLCEYLALRRMLERVPGPKPTFRLAPAGRELIEGQWLGYFAHLVGGYGNVLQAAPRLLKREILYGKDLHRDGRLVAVGSELIGKNPHHRSYAVAFERAAAGKPEAVADLGCGSARFLIELVRRTGAHTGVGIDVSAEACALARETIKQEKVEDRVRVVEGDVRRVLEADPKLESSVDVCTAMFVIHELFGTDLKEASARIAEIARILRPKTGRLIIVDKATDALDEGLAPPYFTEFKLVHDLTNQTLINRPAWHRVLHDAGLEIASESMLGAHTGTVLFECARR